MLVGTRCVADDAEGDKGNTLQIAHLCNGSRLHIDGQTLGEGLLDVVKCRAIGYKLVACENEACMNANIGLQRLCRLHQRFIGREARRQALNLTRRTP